MAQGYTGCIDLERISNSLDTLTSVENCINNTDLTTYFEDIENLITTTNLEHGNCITSYKDSINKLYEKLEITKKEITNLKDALNSILERFSNVEEISSNDIKDLSTIYKGTNSSNKINTLLSKNNTINISNNINDFNNNIDDSIKDYMVSNTTNEYPTNYSSQDEWKSTLLKKYDNLNLTNTEKENLVSRDMSVWRQEQTGSKVSSLASSNVEKVQNLSDRYMARYNMNREDANTVASLREELNAVKESNVGQNAMNSISDRLSVIENKYNINLRKSIAQSMSSSTVPPVTQQPTETTSSSYNTVPIGLGIAAAGITGALGAVIIDDKKYKENKKRKMYYDDRNSDDDIQLEGTYDTSNNINQRESFASETSIIDKQNLKEIEDNTPYHASRDRNSINKFYDEEDDFFYRSDDDE